MAPVARLAPWERSASGPTLEHPATALNGHDLWPSLPPEEPLAPEDWEAALRAWERVRRLEREQRGV